MTAERHVFAVRCPQCKRRVRITADISGRLVIDDGKPAALRITCKAKPSAHQCGHRTLVPLPGMTKLDELDEEDDDQVDEDDAAAALAAALEDPE